MTAHNELRNYERRVGGRSHRVYYGKKEDHTDAEGCILTQLPPRLFFQNDTPFLADIECERGATK